MLPEKTQTTFLLGLVFGAATGAVLSLLCARAVGPTAGGTGGGGGSSGAATLLPPSDRTSLNISTPSLGSERRHPSNTVSPSSAGADREDCKSSSSFSSCAGSATPSTPHSTVASATATSSAQLFSPPLGDGTATPHSTRTSRSGSACCSSGRTPALHVVATAGAATAIAAPALQHESEVTHLVGAPPRVHQFRRTSLPSPAANSAEMTQSGSFFASFFSASAAAANDSLVTLVTTMQPGAPSSRRTSTATAAHRSGLEEPQPGTATEAEARQLAPLQRRGSRTLPHAHPARHPQQQQQQQQDDDGHLDGSPAESANRMRRSTLPAWRERAVAAAVDATGGDEGDGLSELRQGRAVTGSPLIAPATATTKTIGALEWSLSSARAADPEISSPRPPPLRPVRGSPSPQRRHHHHDHNDAAAFLNLACAAGANRSVAGSSIGSDSSNSGAASVSQMSFALVKRAPRSYKRGRLIAHGGHSSVFTCLNEDTGMIMAAKIVAFNEADPRVEALLQRTHTEVNILRSISHEHIVRYYHAVKGPEGHSLYIFTEYVANGTVQNAIECFGALAPRVASSYVEQLLRAVVYLHEECGICHMDLKASNLLLAANGVVKLADFGSALRVDAAAAAAAAAADMSLEGGSRELSPVLRPASAAGPSQTTSAHPSSCFPTPMMSASAGDMAEEGDERERATNGSGADVHGCNGCASPRRGQGLQSAMSLPLTPPASPVAAAAAAAAAAAVTMRGMTGTVTHMAPEVVRGEAAAAPRACDVWALGCCLMEMLTGQPPWAHVAAERFGLLHSLGSIAPDAEALPERFAMPPEVTREPAALDFVVRCLHPNPQRRATARELLAHPFARLFREAVEDDELSRTAHSSPATPSASTPLLHRHLARSVRRAQLAAAAAAPGPAAPPVAATVGLAEGCGPTTVGERKQSLVAAAQ